MERHSNRGRAMEEREERWVIDSIEDGVAALETEAGEIVHLPKRRLPRGAREGQVLRVTLRAGEADPAAGVRGMRIDREATEAAQREVRDLADRLREGDSGGDLAL